ncbi:hypothetical protein D3C78_1960610 [compost metagenome]
MVYALALVGLAAGYACFHKAGFWPWQQKAEAQEEDGPSLPYFITVSRPEAPRADK